MGAVFGLLFFFFGIPLIAIGLNFNDFMHQDRTLVIQVLSWLIGVPAAIIGMIALSHVAKVQDANRKKESEALDARRTREKQEREQREAEIRSLERTASSMAALLAQCEQKVLSLTTMIKLSDFSIRLKNKLPMTPSLRFGMRSNVPRIVSPSIITLLAGLSKRQLPTRIQRQIYQH